jgi:hypothetical protein
MHQEQNNHLPIAVFANREAIVDVIFQSDGWNCLKVEMDVRKEERR